MELRAGDVHEVVIESIGAQGDGIARLADARLFVPLTLPGERLRVRLEGRRGEGFAAVVLERLGEVARAEPSCPHFGACGGCQLQHVPPGLYSGWLRDQVGTALARRGLGDVPVEDPVITPPASRRRARFAWRREGRRMRFGFRAHESHRIEDLNVCPVVRPEIAALVAPLRDLLAGLERAGRAGEVQVTCGETGLDLLFLARDPPDLAARERLAAFAEARDLARIAWQSPGAGGPEPIAARRPVRVRFEAVGVDVPPGAFLQASAEAEAAIRAAVHEALGDADPIADLFAGLGTFALPFAAAGRRVRALERDPAMQGALAAAARAAGLAARVESSARDLERRPLEAGELAGFGGVVLDPPRAGARAQAARLAASGVPRIAMVSCNPATFARDARILVDGGHRLAWVRPIDPFLWSAQLELVGAFAR